ncbi:MAG: hypothetical protein HC854_03625 [Flavobacterium sp.]|nr:hypothetical protein [Flavobacterium sp.]
MIKKHLIVILTISIFLSCQQVIEKAADKIVEEKQELIGNYHTIKSENIKIFLPQEFKYIPSKEYINYISKSKDTFIINAEKNRLELVKNSE